MREPTFLIRTALALDSRHGYGIITDVETMTAGRVRLRAGVLYFALDRLRLDGLVRVDREDVVESRLRRYYRLTPRGEQRWVGEGARFHYNTAAVDYLDPDDARRSAGPPDWDAAPTGRTNTSPSRADRTATLAHAPQRRMAGA
ncbi:MAG: PadR family transcriptional regulator [Acidimicrobiales bacterium]